MKEVTHIATHKKSGKKVKVYFNEQTGEYQESFMICLKDVGTAWTVEPITQE